MTTKTKKSAKKTQRLKRGSLPLHVMPSDLVAPDWVDEVPGHVLDEYELLPYSYLQFHDTPEFGWVLCVMRISKTPFRCYGVQENGNFCVINSRTIVSHTIKVYLTKRNLTRLLPLLETFRTGLSTAEEVQEGTHGA